jgi:hypothetical protein
MTDKNRFYVYGIIQLQSSTDSHVTLGNDRDKQEIKFGARAHREKCCVVQAVQAAQL